MLNYLTRFYGLLPLSTNELKASLSAYLEQQYSYCSDARFSAQFPWKELHLPQDFFLQREIVVGIDRYLTGPRFYGGNIKRPFIEIVAETAPLDINKINIILDEWKLLGTDLLRITRRIDQPVIGEIDQFLYMATTQAMSECKMPLCRLRTANADDLPWCMEAIEQTFAFTMAEMPILRERVIPCDHDEISEGIEAGEVFIIEYDHESSGLIYLPRSSHSFLSGFLMTEEIVLPGARGKGLAAQAQCLLAESLSRKSPDALFMGTIDALNLASQKTAAHAGRKPLLRYEFVTVEDFS